MKKGNRQLSVKNKRAGARFSQFYRVWVRPDIAKEFTETTGKFDDMLAGLHEVRARMWDEAGHDINRLVQLIHRKSSK